MNIRQLLHGILLKTGYIRKSRDEINKSSIDSNYVPPSELFDVLRRSVGMLLSSLGDDTVNVIMVPDGRDISEIGGMYLNLTSWFVEASKSLASRLNIEYLREQSHAAYYVDYKCFNQESLEKYRRFIVVCKPTVHVGKTWIFAESLSRISPLVDELALIFQTYNLNLIPSLDILIDKMRTYHIPKYDFFINEVDYVPIYNVAAWSKAQKPKAGSKHHIKIKSLFHAMEIAGREANWFVSNILKNKNISGDKILLDGLGVGWTKANMDDLNVISSFEASRLARYLEALRKGERVKAQEIVDEVKLIDTDFFGLLNGIKDSNETDLEESNDITLFYHSISLKHYKSLAQGRRR